MSGRARAVGAAAGLLADRLAGDPPDRWHPVAWFGTAMGAWERCWWADARAAGARHAALGLGLGVAAGRLLDAALGPGAATAAATAVAAGGRGLADAADRIDAALAAGDLPEARRLLPWLAGRDPTGLDETELARAVVESVAENTVDAVVAPAVWAAATGASGVLAHRAANTMDAMVGHRDERYARYGWAPARLDDAAAWLPARLTALAVAVVRPRRAGAIARTVRRDAPAHPSPNAGVAEAAFAAALGVQLGGTNVYRDRVEHRPRTGDGRAPTPDDVAGAVRLSRDVTLAVVAVLLAAAGVSGRGTGPGGAAWRGARR